jgi:integrase/recombinase XerD
LAIFRLANALQEGISMVLNTLFDQFKKEKTYLKGVSQNTIIWYDYSYRAFKNVCGDVSELSKQVLNEFVIGMRQSGISAVTVNNYIRGMNVFFTWLYENEYTAEHFKIKKVKEEQKVLKVFSDNQLKAIIKWKPKGWYQWRLYALLSTIIDTGIRIDEALSLTRSDINFDDLLIIVTGKGDKQRIIPFSPELRKILWRWSRMHEHQYFFPSKTGNKYMYDNLRRDMKALGEQLGIEGVRVSPHTLRHYFAIHFLRRGGDLYTLSRILGHTNIQTTQIYLRSMGIEQIRESHLRLSPLNNFR